jgi:hypothetical protein
VAELLTVLAAVGGDVDVVALDGTAVAAVAVAGGVRDATATCGPRLLAGALCAVAALRTVCGDVGTLTGDVVVGAGVDVASARLTGAVNVLAVTGVTAGELFVNTVGARTALAAAVTADLCETNGTRTAAPLSSSS